MIELDHIDDIAIVRMTHGKVNALDVELLRAITATFRELAESSAPAVVFTGAGRAFSAGVDLWRIADGGDEHTEEFLPALNECFLTVFNCPKPVVAAVNGHAIAGGCILVSCCDRRLMSGGRIGVTELLVGVPFPITPLSILGFAAGPARAREAVLSAATYEPADALTLGLIDAVVEPEALLEASLAEARRLVALTPPDTFRFTKWQLRREVNERLNAQRPVQDPMATDLWQARVADGTIRAYMDSVTRKG